MRTFVSFKKPLLILIKPKQGPTAPIVIPKVSDTCTIHNRIKFVANQGVVCGFPGFLVAAETSALHGPLPL